MGSSSVQPRPPVRFVPLAYDSQDSDASARRRIHALRPDWEEVDFVRFTDGITNTLLKAANRRPALSKEEVDKDAILLRAYGHGTDVLIDRQRETQNHDLLMRHGLAAELLARFENGIMYRFTRGTITRPEDLRRPDISRAIARRLAQWHATMPCLPGRIHGEGNSNAVNGHTNGHSLQHTIDNAAPGKQAPNLWTVIQKWIFALPAETETQSQRRDGLQAELDLLIRDLSQEPGLGKDGLVFAHNDLLGGNVIILPPAADCEPTVTFIDYEYAVPSPAAFDIANHFAEWGGFDCDTAVLPTRSQRRLFIDAYVRAYAAMLPGQDQTTAPFDPEVEAARLLRDVDLFRGVPGFYWGIWALIQARISDINFDYASYAETRLAEYWAWKAERDGTRAASGEDMPPREQRWAQEI